MQKAEMEEEIIESGCATEEEAIRDKGMEENESACKVIELSEEAEADVGD